MANSIQDYGLVIQVALAVASLLFVAMGVLLVNMAAYKRMMSRVFPEEGLPYKHYAYRRVAGITYIIAGMLVAASIFQDIPFEVGELFPFWCLGIASANTVFATAMVLTLIYASRMAFAAIVVEAIVVVVLFVAFLLTSDAAKEMVRHTWMIVLCTMLLTNTYIYIRSRQRYLRTMFGLLGSEAIDYAYRHLSWIYVPSIILSLLSGSTYLIGSGWDVLLLIICFSIYYVGLGMYFRRQSYDCAAVEEAMANDFDWKRTPDKHWRRMINEF